ncbi:MAG TPA: tripartite tricarboxylate transporter substrate binding protein [Bradyrhizobium sp.]|jgi:tripartite-type tricarboxylate transporter receptor subunit TctC|nr:tripartite tricarboxylate transporter substrate binding protein [Bradyrhizobium sp.]
MQRVPILAIALLAVGQIVLEPAPARAGDWPQGTVRIITPFPAGTGADLAARIFAERLTSRWGKPVVVENKPGGDGILAVTAFLGTQDEHTIILMNGGPLTSNPFSHDKLPYDPVNDFVPISSAADVLVAVSAPASLQVDSLANFLNFASAHTGKLNWGATPGALDYIVPGFLKRAGLNMTHVPYRQIAPALQDLGEERIHLYASALATQLSAVHSGKVRPLVVTNRERTELLPEVQTATEAGFGDLEFEGFLGFFGPRGMQKELQERISADIRASGADPALAARLSAAGLRMRTNSPAELSEIVERERRKVAEFARTTDRSPK